MALEVVTLPVSDVDRAKEFYVRLGWRVDADLAPEEDFRVVQLTPPGSSCSIIFGAGLTEAAPGSARGLILVVNDIDAGRAHLLACGVAAGEVFHDSVGVFHHAGGNHRISGAAPHRRSYGSFVEFADPDGNGWFMQEVTKRLPGR